MKATKKKPVPKGSHIMPNGKVMKNSAMTKKKKKSSGYQVMYSIILATMLSANAEATVPKLVSTYDSLRECRLELLEVAKVLEYERVVSPLLGYSVSKEKDGKTTIAFCVHSTVSI